VPDTTNNPISNTPEFTVSELAFSLKRTVEETFGHVRVRGELGRVTIAKSGHCYLDVKDDKAVINSIIWKGVMNRLSMRPEEGMEVICEGKLSTYPGRSNYQLIIDKMELAGAGALMALFEKRKKMLAAEGLFAAERKRELPFMPKTIGVVTSPTGSVIRDILHRIEDRFPSNVLVWPVLVQGDRAAEQITQAIKGFNQAEGFARPDVLIVARGGGERLFEPMRQRLMVQRLPPLKSLLTEFSRSLEVTLARLTPALSASQNRHASRLTNAAQRLRPEPIQRNAARQAQTLSQITARTEQAINRKIDQDKQRLAKAAQLLDAYSYQSRDGIHALLLRLSENCI